MAPEEAGDEDANGPPPHPLDRPWVHPSELFAGRQPSPSRVRRRGFRSRDVLLAVSAGVVGALAMVVVLAIAGLLGDSTSSSTDSRAVDQPNEPDSAARVAAIANHSVVGILASTPLGIRRISGVCVRTGQVITSAAAIQGATALTVVGADGARRTGTLVGQDPTTRLALVRVDGGPDPAKLAANGDLQVGQWILALGGTNGSGPWVATGVVAALGGWAEDGSGSTTAGMITVDAVMPPEAQGGALLDRNGHVVGILAGATKDEMGGLATPIATVRDVAAQLAETGKALHGALGIRTSDQATPRGARVVSVLEGSAAAAAGLAAEDVVVKVDDETIHNAADLVVAVRLRQPDDRVQITILRRQHPKRVMVTLGSAETTSSTQPATAVSTG
ncbi:MAG: S1C family serine protease [Acidimicrobiia bacterium]